MKDMKIMKVMKIINELFFQLNEIETTEKK